MTVFFRAVLLSSVFSIFLSACGSEDAEPVSPPTNLQGMWSATTASIGSATAPIPDGEFYFLFENNGTNPILGTLYAKSDNLNCLTADPGTLTHYGNNNYKDGFGDEAKFVVTGNTMTMSFEFEGQNMQMKFDSTPDISAQDFQLCSSAQAENKPSVILDDQSSDNPQGLITTIKNEILKK